MMQTGPFITAALIAEKVLTEPDKVSTLVRIIDRTSIPADFAANFPQGENVLLPLAGFFCVKAGTFSGTCRMRLYQIGPSGSEQQVGDEGTFVFPANEPDAGINVQSPVVVKWEGAGQYWFEMRLDNVPFCRVPLHINVGQVKAPKKEATIEQRGSDDLSDDKN